MDDQELDLPAVHQQALDATLRIVIDVRADHLDRPTPCDDWDVRELLGHIVGGNHWAKALMDGETIEEVGDRFDGDLLGDDPLGAYGASATEAGEAFAAPGAMEAMAAVSYGPVPGSVYCGHRILDVVLHGWDLATAIGSDATIEPDLVDACWTILEPQLDLLVASGAFGTYTEAAADADPATRLLLATGRTP